MASHIPAPHEVGCSPTYEISLGGGWTAVSEEEQKQLEAGFSTGLPSFQLESRGQFYRIDAVSMLQINSQTGKARQIRRQPEGAALPESVGLEKASVGLSLAHSDDDWLTDAFFYRALCETFAAAGVQVETRADELFDFTRNQDFRQMQDNGKVLKRGGMPYRIPCGWKRFAVKVSGKYDAGDDTWLGDDEFGWAVAYHGTEQKNLPGILSTGFHVGSRQKFEAEVGAGVYCTPDLRVASYYAYPQLVSDHSVQIVLQMRVKPEAIKAITTGQKRWENKYWVINDPRDVRAYGVLIRETPADAKFDKSRNRTACCAVL
eukprot:gnl/TRDRNA2_/TRDRNA2_65541_c0_seq1.p1 gnl/TRDRNA2_/TRDRNA2_65541_c0~~gnl/TRDRNA2_/TRDRNA2_65541_c0_seq1.p1  ORF type:complete len:318 (-),score=42.96 gnl/TRDRNA2_/TRDRNA2_65541_c0_seq1:113-1066(-)